jgi:hypothetical protein
MIRSALLTLLFAVAAPAWVESVEFPWNTYPQQLWQRELAWLKNIGITHVSLPPGDPKGLAELIRIIRSLAMEADLEGPVPDALQPLTRAHGGPLTDPLPGPRTPISAVSPNALTQARELIESGANALLWTDVEDTLGPTGYKPGAVNFAGEERSGTTPLRRNAQLSLYWSKNFPQLKEILGVGPKLPMGITARQFTADMGLSVVSVINRSAAPWTGEVKALYPFAKRVIGIPAVTVPAHDALWLPVNVPLIAANAFASIDHLVYATAELTSMEYENGILAMEFAATSPGEVILQLSREPYGPLVAGGKPTAFDWDDKEHRARLTFPKGAGPGNKVRIGLAIEPPDATAFFDSARVLVIGETNHLPAQYSSEAIAQRSRLRTSPGLTVNQQPGKDPLAMIFDITVPATAIHGDHADLAIEADGMQMSHARPQLLRPASLAFPDQIDVHLAANSALPLYPATVPVNQRTGREITITVRNNAPEIRNFELTITAEGLDFSPAKLAVSVGASAARDVSFRVFTNNTALGLHNGVAKLSGAASATEPVQFAVFPQTGQVAFTTAGFSILEGAKTRASFIPGHWLEFIAKDNNRNALPSGGVPFTKGGIEALKLEDLEAQVPKPKK